SPWARHGRFRRRPSFFSRWQLTPRPRTTPPRSRPTMKRTAQLLAALALAVTGCSADSPAPTDNHLAAHEGGLMLSSLSQVNGGQPLAALRALLSPLHDVDNARREGYNLFIATPATAPDGCISDQHLGGMGYHYTRANNLGDDSISLLDPEFIVYAPERTP